MQPQKLGKPSVNQLFNKLHSSVCIRLVYVKDMSRGLYISVLYNNNEIELKVLVRTVLKK